MKADEGANVAWDILICIYYMKNMYNSLRQRRFSVALECSFAAEQGQSFHSATNHSRNQNEDDINDITVSILFKIDSKCGSRSYTTTLVEAVTCCMRHAGRPSQGVVISVSST